MHPANHGNHFKLGKDFLNLSGHHGLNGAHYDILAALFAAAALLQHALGFANARGIAQKHFQPAPPLAAFIRLDAAQKILGVGPAVDRSATSSLFSDRSRPIEIEIQQKHIDPRFAKDAPLAALRTFVDHCLDAVRSHAARGRLLGRAELGPKQD